MNVCYIIEKTVEKFFFVPFFFSVENKWKFYANNENRSPRYTQTRVNIYFPTNDEGTEGNFDGYITQFRNILIIIIRFSVSITNKITTHNFHRYYVKGFNCIRNLICLKKRKACSSVYIRFLHSFNGNLMDWIDFSFGTQQLIFEYTYHIERLF